MLLRKEWRAYKECRVVKMNERFTVSVIFNSKNPNHIQYFDNGEPIFDNEVLRILNEQNMFINELEDENKKLKNDLTKTRVVLSDLQHKYAELLKRIDLE